MSTPPKTLSLENVLAYKPKTKTIPIPALGGSIKVRQMLVSDQEFVAGKLNDESTLIEAQVWMTIRCSVEPAFTEEHFDQLKNLPAGALDEIDDAIEQASGGKVATAKATEKSPVA
jgi:hypothetical protein